MICNKVAVLNLSGTMSLVVIEEASVSKARTIRDFAVLNVEGLT